MNIKETSINSRSDRAYPDCVASLRKLLAYLSTWQTPEGQFGGLIATWWSSTLETAVPHPMNQYPMILGFLELARSNAGGADWLGEAQRVGDGLLKTIRPDGVLSNDWGDIPGKSTGTVIYAAPAFALAELASQSGAARYLEGARRLLRTIDERWCTRGQNSDGVTNQAFKWSEAMLVTAFVVICW